MAVNDLVELPNFRIYTACKKEALQFSAKKGTCSEKILHMTVQHEESEIRRSAIWKECTTKKQHGNSVTQKNNTERMQDKKVQHEKSATRGN